MRISVAILSCCVTMNTVVFRGGLRGLFYMASKKQSAQGLNQNTANTTPATATTKSSFGENIVKTWPSAPFLAYGVWLAWAACMYSGSFWISDTDINGENLSTFYILSTLSFAAVFLLSPFLKKQGLKVICTNRITIAGGLIASIGSLFVVLAGPYYLGSLTRLDALFWTGACLTGIGSSFVSLRLGAMFGLVTPRRSLIYSATSQVVVAFVFFTVLSVPYWAPVAGGPSIAGVISFIFLPSLAAVLTTLPRAKDFPQVDARDYDDNWHDMPVSLWKLIALSFILPAIAGIARGYVVNGLEPEFTVAGNSLITLMRLLIAAIFVWVALSPHTKKLNFGKLFSLVATIMMVLMTCIPLFEARSDILTIFIFSSYVLFDLMQWCLLALIVLQKHISPLSVFGFGRGIFMLGSALGWTFAVYFMPYITGQSSIIFWVVCAGLVLLSSVLLFSESDSVRLFSPISEDELSIESLMNAEIRENTTEDKKGRFAFALNSLAEQYQLTPREQDVLRCLSMGRGSEYIAEKLSISWGTARTHIHNVYVKMDVHSRDELIDLLDGAMKEA